MSDREQQLLGYLRNIRGIVNNAIETPLTRIGQIGHIVEAALRPLPASLLDSSVEQPAGAPEPRVRSGDPGTSREAAEAIVPKLTNQRGRCLRAFVSGQTAHGLWPINLTAAEVEKCLEQRGHPLPTSSVSKRLGELERGGFIERIEGQVRKTSRGGKGGVYRLTDAGFNWCLANRPERAHD